jgi:hypothetical protein
MSRYNIVNDNNDDGTRCANCTAKKCPRNCLEYAREELRAKNMQYFRPELFDDSG